MNWVKNKLVVIALCPVSIKEMQKKSVVPTSGIDSASEDHRSSSRWQMRDNM